MPLFQPTAIFRGVEHITPEYLKENGITALILDVDICAMEAVFFLCLKIRPTK